MVLAAESHLKPVEISLFLFILDSLTDEDRKKVEKIFNSVLIPTKNREERKVHEHTRLLLVNGQLIMVVAKVFGDFMTPLSRNDLMNTVRVKKSSRQINLHKGS